MITPQDIIEDLKIKLLDFLHNSPNKNRWISNNYVNIYVRKKGFLIIDDKLLSSFVFANININETLTNMGIMSALLQWAVDVMPHDLVVVESVVNQRYYNHLLAKGWLDDTRPGYVNVFKYTTHPQ
jgi:hypothetical protein